MEILTGREKHPWEMSDLLKTAAKPPSTQHENVALFRPFVYVVPFTLVILSVSLTV